MKHDPRRQRRDKKMKKTVSQVGELLSSMDLIASCIEKDCGRYKYLGKIKKRAKALRKELRSVYIPKGMKP